MLLSEFEIIARFFSSTPHPRKDVVLGVGDDCALLRVPPGVDLAVSIDTLVEGVHFHPGSDPERLGHKALAVNLSDLAAMGAEPAWVTLALTLPKVDIAWLTCFMRGFSTLADPHQVQLVGGDTTRGPLTISLQVQGFVPPGAALQRDGARPGDLIGVTGTLGDAALALRQIAAAQSPSDYLMTRLEQPLPRVATGLALRGLASAAIDLSDGLLADLGHICERSGVAARLELIRLPLSPEVGERVNICADWSLPLSAGDDYELCFTVPPDHRAAVEAQLSGIDGGLTWIGVIEAGRGVRCFAADGALYQSGAGGYQHFHSTD
ncbi:MAG: thiamine-phosphate kinase [Gammaproteobacteria bacterium]|nr:thiamine-phosphate kinase [Gammaproteobacteria bacterium]MCP5418707.1 thiamine-phosphate kinase [Chromatiaceae bacterium]